MGLGLLHWYRKKRQLNKAQKALLYFLSGLQEGSAHQFLHVSDEEISVSKITLLIVLGATLKMLEQADLIKNATHHYLNCYENINKAFDYIASGNIIIRATMNIKVSYNNDILLIKMSEPEDKANILMQLMSEFGVVTRELPEELREGPGQDRQILESIGRSVVRLSR